MNCPSCGSRDVTFVGRFDQDEVYEADHYDCNNCGEEFSDEYEDGEPDCGDFDDGYALASAGFGTDEDYGGCFDGDY